MTKDRALRLLERHVDMFDARGELREALEALRPKPRKVAGPRVSPASKDVARFLKRPEGWGAPSDSCTVARYLDSFGPKGSPEREAQAARLAMLQDGPQGAEYGAPVPTRDTLPMSDYYAAMRADRDAREAWEASPDGERFAADRAAHEARARHFSYTGPRKGAKPDEVATYVRAFLADDVVPGPALPVAA